MQNQGHFDPRFYFIRLTSLALYRKPAGPLQLIFKLGVKHSETTFSVKQIDSQKDLFKVCEQSICKQVHILKYGAQELLNIYLKDGQKLIGYSRVLLPPLFELPHIKHHINLLLYENIYKPQGSNEEVCPSAELSLDIYFQFNFHGILQIIPVSAHLERNLAQLGQMKPKVRFQFEGQTWCSLPAEGGIHPHWTGHFHTNKTNDGLIQTIDDNLKSNKLEQWARILRMAANQLDFKGEEQEEIMATNLNQKHKQIPYFDCTQFTMKSAGSYLQIQILSDPIFGSKSDVVGSANIRVQDCGFLKHPRQERENYFEQKRVNLEYEDGGEKVSAGVLKLYIRFVFDKSKVIRPDNQCYDLD